MSEGFNPPASVTRELILILIQSRLSLTPHVKKLAWIQWHPAVIVLQMNADQTIAVSLCLILSYSPSSVKVRPVA